MNPSSFLASSESESKITYYNQDAQFKEPIVPVQNLVDNLLDVLVSNNYEEPLPLNISNITLSLDIQHISPSEQSVCSEGNLMVVYYQNSILQSSMSSDAREEIPSTHENNSTMVGSNANIASQIIEQKSIFEAEIQRSPIAETRCPTYIPECIEPITMLTSDEPKAMPIGEPTRVVSKIEADCSILALEDESCCKESIGECISDPNAPCSQNTNEIPFIITDISPSCCTTLSDSCQFDPVSTTSCIIPLSVEAANNDLVVAESSSINVVVDTSMISSGYVNPQTNALDDLIIISPTSDMLDFIESELQTQNTLPKMKHTEAEQEEKKILVEDLHEAPSFYHISDESIVFSSTHLVLDPSCESPVNLVEESPVDLVCDSPVDLECSLRTLSIEDEKIAPASDLESKPPSGSAASIRVKSPTYLHSLKERLGCSII
ncbi:hypothetical protein MDAP_000670 [Mitosporidium daphniae]|uniref:Uncharacterized protein n=1 Tax=Mitosporidium daphniae TaxID=1485682 RepID=A0A098VTV1_9MICR|nr:uncharacterized protein DI09_181p30 [Mitosporidium daphniae]KGG52362.1 hypothetical protein DI09_181p30 [Mitosporidium daphniae]|eukprot:XP_013238798.1 uncharacterized protein DI09_181p30 [Mitosporidium daphniae]